MTDKERRMVISDAQLNILERLIRESRDKKDQYTEETLVTAAACLIKEIPKQLEDRDSFKQDGIVFSSARCPICRIRFDEDDDRWLSKYCPNCGQKLDWDTCD